MNKKHILAMAIGLACMGNVLAQDMTRADFVAAKDSISANYKTAKAACGSLAGNAKDICKVDATGVEKRARADLDARYEPSLKHSYQAEVVKAETGYALAREKCDDLAGNAKDVCVKEAQATQATAKADATLRMKTAEANTDARATKTKAQDKANDKTAAASKDANSDKVDAEYKLAIEKCDALAGAAKDSCVSAAKARYAK
jgi:hypothetical protein